MGRGAVLDNEATIDKFAQEKGVDPDLVKAIIYVENAHGASYGIPAEVVGKADTILPMNVSKKRWDGLDGHAVLTPEGNIAIGTEIVKRIQDSQFKPTPETTATLYNGLGLDKVNDYGARVGEVMKQKTWEKW